MSSTPANGSWYGTARRLALVAFGILGGQSVLYGSALYGGKLLLPLACLAEDTKYLPRIPENAGIKSPSPVLLDFVVLTEPERLFMAREISAGRFPDWVPNRFGGVPFIWAKYSPFHLLTTLTPDPGILVVGQLLLSLFAGFGAFAFCRRVLNLSYWPSAMAAWCYPVTGWFVLFQGTTLVTAVANLPWILFAIDRAIRAKPLGGVGLALATALTVLSGQLDVAAQVLLACVPFALWRAWDVHRAQVFRFMRSRSGLALPVGALLGLLLASAQFLPMREYMREGNRFARREGGYFARPPVGLIAVPQIVLPDMYGTYAETGTCPLLEPVEVNQLESPASGYAGLLAALLLAPWAFIDRQRRSSSWFLLGLAAFGFSWALNLPGLVQFLKLPGLRMMSHNRLVFVSGFALLMLAAIGLENILIGGLARKPRLGAQLAILAVLLGWCLYRASILPEPLASGFEADVRNGRPSLWLHSVDEVRTVQAWFVHRYQKSAVFAFVGIVVWLVFHFRPQSAPRAAPFLGILLLSDLLLFGYGKRIPQDRSLYYPAIPALEQLATAPAGRVLGIGCLPANLTQALGLMDVRGYDAVDPRHWIALLWTGSNRRTALFEYSAVQHLDASFKLVPPSGIQFSPVLDMLSLRYAIFRGAPPPGIVPRFQSPDYWIMENTSALPRVFVPSGVQANLDEESILKALTQPGFDARQVAYVSDPVDLPGPSRGGAEILAEIPTRVTIAAHMASPGLLVLADNWDAGWQAYVNGTRTPVLRTNYSLRGVALPAGESQVEFRYESATVSLGRKLAALSLALLLGWTGFGYWRKRRAQAGAAAPSRTT